MDTALRAVIEAIHAAPVRSVLYVAGGASQALGWLLSVPGASHCLLEAVVPYSQRSMAQLLGKMPLRFVTSEVADDLALAAYKRALSLSPPGIRVAGVGCTCAIASKPLRHGEHRCFITTRRQEELRTYSLLLDKGARDRYAEDQITSQLFTQSLADTFGVQVRGSLFNLTEKDALHSEVKTFTEEQQLAQLLDGEIPMVVFPSERGSCSGRRIVLPGSFNPLHEGHLQLMEAACGLVRDSVPCFEISAINADKPPLQVADIMKRVEQFKERDLMVVVTNEPFFSGKARLIPDSTFVVGVDTAIRLVQTKYYGGSREKMLETMQGIGAQGCEFLVAGRVVSGNFQVLSGIELPPELASIFKAIPESVFRKDISSTEIRQRMMQSQAS